MKILLLGLGLLLVASVVFPNAASPGADRPSPTVIRFVAPPYPPLARESRIVGTTISEVTVAADGSVSNIQIISAHPIFKNEVENALKSWRFGPGGEFKLEITVRFDFEEDDSDCKSPKTYVSADLPSSVLIRVSGPCVDVQTSEQRK